MSVTQAIETATRDEQRAAVGFAYQLMSDPQNAHLFHDVQVFDNKNNCAYSITDLLRALRVLYDSLDEKVLH